jgi:pyruvoyl-dependent arginine decarboxylase (PvlArgDC)
MKESRTFGHIAVPFDKKREGRVDERSDFFETEMSVTLASQLVDFDRSKRALDGGVSKEKDVAKIAVLQSLIEARTVSAIFALSAAHSVKSLRSAFMLMPPDGAEPRRAGRPGSIRSCGVARSGRWK